MDALCFATHSSNATSAGGLPIVSGHFKSRKPSIQAPGCPVPLGLGHAFITWMNVYFWLSLTAIGLLMMFLTYVATTVQFRQAMVDAKCKRVREVPVVPYWIPLVFHAFGFLNPAGYILKLQKSFASDSPLQLRAGPFRFFVFRSVEHIKAVFRASKRTTNKSTTLFALHNLFGLPKEAKQFFQDDDSGLSLKPRSESRTAPENRINYLINFNVKKYLSSDYLDALDHTNMKMLLRHLNTFEVADDWIDFPDLHAFIQLVIMRPAIEALVGSELLKLCPSFIDDLMTFQQSVPSFLRLVPRWLIPRAYRARKRLLEAIKVWHEHAHGSYDCSRLDSEDPKWEPFFGFILMRARGHYTLDASMTPDARATEDLGLIFAATTNVAISMFWFVFEALKNPVLLRQLKAEVDECITNGNIDGQFKKLATQPLLQSTYAEVLRLYVAVMHSRVAEYESINIAGYTIPRDSYVVMYSRSSALDHKAWEQAGRTLRKPLEEFDAERFLVDADWVRPTLARVRNQPIEELTGGSASACANRRFTVEGLLGLWTPLRWWRPYMPRAALRKASDDFDLCNAGCKIRL
ncbi:hypothetical protein PG991_001029 [Apiospora marii]|uniref:Cytochrome P450 n=1 Tax=Apiospora marii TaxID=335849 RepID=A0ABR1SVZ0_9PEZI